MALTLAVSMGLVKKTAPMGAKVAKTNPCQLGTVWGRTGRTIGLEEASMCQMSTPRTNKRAVEGDEAGIKEEKAAVMLHSPTWQKIKWRKEN